MQQGRKDGVLGGEGDLAGGRGAAVPVKATSRLAGGYESGEAGRTLKDNAGSGSEQKVIQGEAVSVTRGVIDFGSSARWKERDPDEPTEDQRGRDCRNHSKR